MKEMNETCEVKCTRSRLSRLLDREWSSRTESAHILCFCLSNMLCLTVLCYAMLCYAMLCYAMLYTQMAQALLAHFRKTFEMLPFSLQWLMQLDRGSFAVNRDERQREMYHKRLRSLVEQNVVRDYLLLSDHRGSYGSQWEHRLIQRSSCYEVLPQALIIEWIVSWKLRARCSDNELKHISGL